MEKIYRVKKFVINGQDSDCGCLPESDVKRLLKGYKYDKDFDMWFSPKANIGYSVEEI